MIIMLLEMADDWWWLSIVVHNDSWWLKMVNDSYTMTVVYNMSHWLKNTQHQVILNNAISHSRYFFPVAEMISQGNHWSTHLKNTGVSPAQNVAVQRQWFRCIRVLIPLRLIKKEWTITNDFIVLHILQCAFTIRWSLTIISYDSIHT